MTKKALAMEFQTPYSERKRVGFETTGESLTQQHLKDETDIRKIISKYDRTGLISHVARGVAQYGDFSEINEYREALDVVNNANAVFSELPAEIRQKFANDAGAFFEFATDPNNMEEMVNMGLATKPATDADVVSSPSAEAEETPAQQEG
jgi:phage internal scaffolding protein